MGAPGSRDDVTTTDTAAIVGGGTAASFGKLPERTVVDLAAEALGNALDDAGLTRDELDGLVSNVGTPLTHNYDRLTEALGLDVDLAAQYWSHGRWAGSALQYAAMAVRAGLADYVAVGLGLQFNTLRQFGGETGVGLAEVGSVSEHAERPWYGTTAPVGASALATRYYMERYGATGADLSHVAVTFRHNAGLDPRSHFTEPIDVTDHQASPYVVDPLRRLDCAPLSDGGAYVVVTSAANAETTASEPAYVTAMRGLPAGPENPLFGRGWASVPTASTSTTRAVPTTCTRAPASPATTWTRSTSTTGSRRTSGSRSNASASAHRARPSATSARRVSNSTHCSRSTPTADFTRTGTSRPGTTSSRCTTSSGGQPATASSTT